MAIEIYHVERTGLFDIDTVDAHECVDDGLAAVCGYWIGEGVGHDIHGHAFVETDSVAHSVLFDCDSVKHDFFMFGRPSLSAGMGIRYAKDVRQICFTSFNFRYRQTP